MDFFKFGKKHPNFFFLILKCILPPFTDTFGHRVGIDRRRCVRVVLHYKKSAAYSADTVPPGSVTARKYGVDHIRWSSKYKLMCTAIY